jgi:hypothetical protein
MPASPADSPRPRERGQAMVEFAMVMLPLLLIIVGIIQFGLLFGANVSITNAAREGARAATIYVYNLGPSMSRAKNDIDRCSTTLTAASQAFGLASASGPNFVAAVPCPDSSATDLNGDGMHDRWTNGDLILSLCGRMATPTSPCPNTADSTSYCTETDAAGCLVRVELTYRSDIIVPLLSSVLPTDTNGRFVQRAVATMMVN